MEAVEVVKLVAECVANGHTVRSALRKVAKISGKTVAATTSIYYRSDSHQDLTWRRKKLTDEQNSVLLGMLVGFSGANIAWTLPMLIDATRVLFGVEVSYIWARRWVDSHKQELSQRNAKRLTQERDADAVLRSVQVFVREVQADEDTFAMRPHTILNADETRVCVGGRGQVVLERRGKSQGGIRTFGLETLGTLLPFVTAGGEVVCTFWVMKANVGAEAQNGVRELDVVVDDQPYELRGTWPKYYTFSQSGYLNNHLFELIFVQFLTCYRNKYPHVRARLYLDQLHAHKNLRILSLGLARGVDVWLLPAHCSHFAQPLDSAPFASFKHTIARSTYSASVFAALGHQQPSQAAAALAFAAEDHCLDTRAIAKGFRLTGIFPWAPDSLLRAAKEQVGQGPRPHPGTQQELNAQFTKLARAWVARGEEQSKKVSKRRMVVNDHALHQPERRGEFLRARQAEKERKAEAIRHRREQKESLRAQHEAEREARCCRESTCHKRWRGGRAWYVCATCGFLLCPQHKSTLVGAPHLCGDAGDQ